MQGWCINVLGWCKDEWVNEWINVLGWCKDEWVNEWINVLGWCMNGEWVEAGSTKNIVCKLWTLHYIL